MVRKMTSTDHSEDIDMVLYTDTNPVSYAPPAHLADRLSRKSSHRRKTSARSSRRNSLSSRHSHQSSLSAHGGPFSTHVAQHLRRASIIESRKARLADKAAHAERVRLRAALAKATPRQSHSEEKALAAQATRERMLAEVAAKCEEEVRRVKKVAEETKEKKAAEHARLKDGMAEKFADAARRKLARQQTIRRARTASLPAVEENDASKGEDQPLEEDLVAGNESKTPHERERCEAVRDFRLLNLTPDRIKAMTFEECGAILSDENVLATASRALQALQNGQPSKENKADRGAVRVFLGIFLILSHPKHTFSYGGKDPQEQELINRAEELWKAVQLALDPGQVPVKAADAGFFFAFNKFSTAFHSWKTRDSGSLVDIMVKQFVELDLILQSTKNDVAGGVAGEYAQAIQDNQVQLLARLKKFAGSDEALSMVRTAVKKARKQRLHSSRKSVPGIPSFSPEATQGLGFGGASEALELPAPEASTNKRSKSPPSTNFGRVMTILPSNRELSHEIQLNGTYQIEQEPWTDVRAHFVNSLQSGMRRSMESEGDAAAVGWTSAMAAFTREKLMGLITKQHPLYDRLDGFLDLKLIQQTAQAGMFSYGDFFNSIANIIGQLCSPGRDQAVKEFANDTESDTISRLFSLIKIIDLMRLDHVNFQLLVASPGIVEHGWQHEAELFSQDLSNGVHTLDNLKRWWAEERTDLAAAIVGGNVDAVHGDLTYARGLTGLVLSNTPPEFDALPETLRLDWRRLLSLRAQVFKMVATSSILLTTKIRLKRNRSENWTTEADRLMSLWDTSEGLTAERMLNALESGRRIPDAIREGLLNFVGRVLPATLSACRTAAQAIDAARTPQSPQARSRPGKSKQSQPRFRGTASTTGGATAANKGAVDTPSATFTEQISTFILKSLREHVFMRLSSSANISSGIGTTTTSSSSSLHHTDSRVQTTLSHHHHHHTGNFAPSFSSSFSSSPSSCSPTTPAAIVAPAATTDHQQQLTKMSMGEFVVGVSGVIDVLERIRRVDLNCHGRWYDELGRGSCDDIGSGNGSGDGA